MNKKILFILLDAFRGDYINPIDTPFLYSKSSRGIFSSKLKTTTGYTQQTAIYTGAAGLETGMFTMFTFDSEHSPFRFLRKDRRLRNLINLIKVCDYFQKWRGYRGFLVKSLRKFALHREQAFRSWISQKSKKYASNAPPAHIPLWLLPEIGVSEGNRPIHLPNAFYRESIFDVFTQEGIGYEYLMYPVVNCEDNTVQRAFFAAREGKSKVLLGQFSDSDMLIHLCGPSSVDRRKVTGEIDRKLRELAACYGNSTTWIIIGDHGMADVTEEINVPQLLIPLEKECQVRFGRDYLLFLDSTMARFFWKTEKGEKFGVRMRGVSVLDEKGFFVDPQNSKKYKVPMQDRCYGDLIWCANQGVLLFPDYFHDNKTHNKGMHGYLGEYDEMKGFFLAFGPRIKPRILNQVDLIDVCPTLCSAVGVRPPLSNRGVSLLDI